jgi:DNA-directed RNA polymerase sigma subunit (sigma70/sigma32)
VFVQDTENLELYQFTCALDAAEEGFKTLQEVGQIMNLTRERVRQIQEHAMLKLQKHIDKEQKKGH